MTTDTDICIGLSGLNNMARFDAVGAHDHPFLLSLNFGSYPLEVGIEASIIDIVSMAHIVTHHRFFSAYFTSF